MSIVFICPNRDVSQWVNLIEDYEVQIWPHIKNPQHVELAIAWNPPANIWGSFKNLKIISSLGAGVDHLLKYKDLPDIPVVRVVDVNLTRDMCGYVLMALLNYQRNFKQYLQQQQNALWQPIMEPLTPPVVGLLGLGVLGAAVAQQLVTLDYKVVGYSLSPKQINGVETFNDNSGLEQMMGQIDVLINLLPLTASTRDILNHQLFNMARRAVYLINVARGAHLVESDLITALDTGKISGACLDVFKTEPLPASSPLWRHPQITITPHIASITDPSSALAQILDNFKRLQQNEPLLNRVDPLKGY